LHFALDGALQLDVDGERDVAPRNRFEPARLFQITLADPRPLRVAVGAAHHLLPAALSPQIAFPTPLDTHGAQPIAGAIILAIVLGQTLGVDLAQIAEHVRT